jgi:hypothetical protein
MADNAKRSTDMDPFLYAAIKEAERGLTESGISIGTSSRIPDKDAEDKRKLMITATLEADSSTGGSIEIIPRPPAS